MINDINILFWSNFLLFAAVFAITTASHSIVNKKSVLYHGTLWITQVVSVSSMAICAYEKSLAPLLSSYVLASVTLVLLGTAIFHYRKSSSRVDAEWIAQKARINKHLFWAFAIIAALAIFLGIKGENGLSNLTKTAAKNRVDIRNIKITADSAKKNSDTILYKITRLENIYQEQQKKEQEVIKQQANKEADRKKKVGKPKKLKTKKERPVTEVKKPEPEPEPEQEQERESFFRRLFNKVFKNT